jgi:hypothetical protein
MGLSYISMDTYRGPTEPKQTLWEVFQNSPLADVELEECPENWKKCGISICEVPGRQ